MILSQLLLVPLLTIFCWMYLRFRPAGISSREVMWFDTVVVVLAVLLSVLGLIVAARYDSEHSAPVWPAVLSVLTTFHIFPLVLVIGWWLRRRIFRSASDT